MPREEAWKKYRKTRKGYLHDEDSFNAGWQAGEREMRERAADKAGSFAGALVSVAEDIERAIRALPIEGE